MDAERLQLKLYARDPGAVELEPFVSLFHQWIQNGTIDNELLIDVADYSHVHQGPGVVLIGHQSDYYVDVGDGRPGLLYSRKREVEGDLRARLTDVFRRALRAGALIEQADELQGAVRFDTSELLFRVNDRLRAPNQDETLEQIRPELERVLEQLFAGSTFRLDREGEPRELFSVRIHADESVDVPTLLQRLS